MKRDLTIEDIYKERNISKFIQIIRILNLTDIFFPIDIISEEYQEFVLEEYRQYKTLFREIKDLRLSKYRLQDYKIELKDKTKLKFHCIYSFNNDKFEVFQEYIEKNLKKGYIRPL